MSPTLFNTLKDYIEDHRYDTEPTDYLFPNGQNGQLTKDALGRSFSRYAKKRNVGRTAIHSLRHQFCTDFILNGGNPLELQHIAGHSDLKTTQQYVKLNHETVKPAFLAFNPLEHYTKGQSRKMIVKRR